MDTTISGKTVFRVPGHAMFGTHQNRVVWSVSQAGDRRTSAASSV